MAHSESNSVRQYVVTQYMQPAQARGDQSFKVRAGDIHKALGLKNRVPLVCNALKSRRLLRENHLVLKGISGPPSGLSTTVEVTYEFASDEKQHQRALRNPLWDLFGIAKSTFAELGGGENFIRQERDQFFGVATDQESIGLGGNHFADVWKRLVAHAGETFHTADDLTFRYALAGGSVWIERNGRIVEQELSQTELQKAWERWPVRAPDELQDLRGHSYILAILSDARIS